MKSLFFIGYFLIFGKLYLNADYQMTLYDKSGLVTNQCIKSYSFSNNVESLLRDNILKMDIYAESETLTNKIYLNKMVYRKIIKPLNTHSTHYIFIANDIQFVTNIDARIFYNLNGTSFYSQEVMRGSYSTVLYDVNRPNELNIYLYSQYIDPLKTFYIVEYIKTSDNVFSLSSKVFKSYLHYVRSNSLDVITQDLEDVGVKFLKGYEYNDATNSCVKIIN